MSLFWEIGFWRDGLMGPLAERKVWGSHVWEPGSWGNWFPLKKRSSHLQNKEMEKGQVSSVLPFAQN